jgi:predicted nucleotidyltransferase component of viral defense system
VIDKSEIDAKSEELGVHTSHVQRDYVFGWILAGLYQHENLLSRQVMLKGGNAFRKAYFEHARYSNDLDFSTYTELSEEQLSQAITLACEYAGDLSGVEFAVGDTRVGSRATGDEPGKLYEARVYFKNFYAEEDVTLRIDLDVKEFDRVVLPVQERNLVHAYSDAEDCAAVLKVHKLEELLASKLVAMLRRQHSPDLFDFVHSIFFQKTLEVSRREVITTFLRKTIYEPTPQIARGLLLDLPFAVFRGLWEKYLVCPKSSLIAFDSAEQSFRSIIGELFALVAPQPAFATARGGAQQPSYFGGSVRNKLLEAGRLQRILRMVYDGVQRRVEPYALAFKRRKDGVGQEYFYGWDLSGGRSGNVGIKSFFPDKVTSADITEETFVPRFPIEMAKGGVGYFSAPGFRSNPRLVSYRRTTRSGPTYTIQCSHCGKQFKRKTRTTRLNEHKDRFGNRCYGRNGFLVSVG